MPHRSSRPAVWTALLVASLSGAAIALATTGCARKPVAPAPRIDETSLRRPPAGEVVGFTGQYGSHVWKGLPYAAAPVGDRRWRAPEPIGPWSGRREALRSGSPCPQVASPFAGVVDQTPGTFAGDEDCLFLDVYAPRVSPEAVPAEGARLPVMVWIHGGGNVIGHAGFYDGGHLAQSQDVVVVAINYRLGPLGFLRHAALRAEAANALEASGNFALLDQIRALEWVRDNIASFGGDPQNVTIFGESAGARDVLALVLSEPARGLFHRAIAESGAVRTAPLEEAEAFTDDPIPGHRNSSNEILLRYLQQTGAATDRDAARAKLAAMEPARVASVLHGISAADLIGLYQTEQTEGLIDVPNVFSDGVVLPSGPPLEGLADPAGHAHVPVLLGTNRDEMKVFMFPSPRYVKRLLWVVPRLRDPALYDAVAKIQTAAWTVVGADAPADAMVRSGFDDVFVYRWDWDEEPTTLGADLSEMIGAAHGFEIPFVFGHWYLGPRADVVWTEENRAAREQLSAAMMSYWAEFARSGDPGRGVRGQQPAWQRWGSGGSGQGARIVFDTAADGGVRMESGRTSPNDVVALVDANATALGPDGLCEMAEVVASRFRGISAVADGRAASCRRGEGASHAAGR